MEDYRLAQKGKDKKNPEDLLEGQLVFFEVSGKEVTSIGPVRMYKNAYKYSTGDLLKALGKEAAKEDNAFMRCGDADEVCPACQLFGYVPSNENASQQALAGRLFFSTARCNEKIVESNRILLHILASPKPKYYPFYLIDDKRQNNYQLPNSNHPAGSWTWQDKRSRPRGRKFYWHHLAGKKTTDWKTYLSSHPLENGGWKPQEKSNQNITVESLPAGTKFRFDIKFENLSEIELGLLLFSIALDDGDEGTRYHHIGMGKSLGMGSVKLHIENVKIYDKKERYKALLSTGLYEKEKVEETIKQARNAFKRKMERANNPKQRDFDKIPNIADLLRIADAGNPPAGDVRYRPLNLKPDENFLWFTGEKQRRKTHYVYSSLRRPLPTIVEVSSLNKVMTPGEWLAPRK